jgi:FAD binding domain
MLTRNIRTGQLLELDSSRTPFAIRCSGSTGSPGFSSTRGGVQISMIRFNEIVLSKDEKTVKVGAGLTWTSVHQYLVPKDLNVVGALAWRVSRLAEVSLIQPSRTSCRIPTHRLSSLARGRVFLEDQPVWSYYRHSYGVRTRTSKRVSKDSHRERRRPLVRAQGTPE